MGNPKVFLKLIDGFTGEKVPVLCNKSGDVLDGQVNVKINAGVDRLQTATVEFFVEWLKDDPSNKVD